MAILMIITLRRVGVTAYARCRCQKPASKPDQQGARREEVVITRRGKPVVELRPAARQAAPAPGTHEWLRARTRARPGVGLTSGGILDLVYESKED
jgi:hypothetical protein